MYTYPSVTNNAKVIVCAHWTNLIWALQMFLAKVGIFSSALHGSLTMEARERMAQEFQLKQRDDDHPCIQLSDISSQYDAIPTVIKIAWFLEGC